MIYILEIPGGYAKIGYTKDQNTWARRFREHKQTFGPDIQLRRQIYPGLLWQEQLLHLMLPGKLVQGKEVYAWSDFFLAMEMPTFEEQMLSTPERMAKLNQSIHDQREAWLNRKLPG